MKDLNAIDKQNLDGAYGATAVAMDWPEDLSEKAKEALGYLDDTAYLFHYLGKYIITDESLLAYRIWKRHHGQPLRFSQSRI